MVSSIALKMGIKMIEKSDIVKTAIEQLKRERKNLISRLNKIDGFTAFRSKASFVLVHMKQRSRSVYESLLNEGIIVRDLGQVLHLKNCIRVSVAPPSMMNRFLMTLTKIAMEHHE